MFLLFDLVKSREIILYLFLLNFSWDVNMGIGVDVALYSSQLLLLVQISYFSSTIHFLSVGFFYLVNMYVYSTPYCSFLFSVF